MKYEDITMNNIISYILCVTDTFVYVTYGFLSKQDKKTSSLNLVQDGNKTKGKIVSFLSGPLNSTLYDK